MNMRIVRWVAFVSGLVPALLAPFCADAEEKSQVTVEQVDKAIREVEKLAQRKFKKMRCRGLLSLSSFKTSSCTLKDSASAM
jgi:hypothetical protein